tara:strand:- start:123 stop:389 length:267 start_codon:yes stop_codon:yes gene_type:complete
MRTPIPFDKLVFSELISVAREVPILRTLAPQVKIPMPDVPASTPKRNSGAKSGITTNQILIGAFVSIIVAGAIYYIHKYNKEEPKKSM